MPGLPPLPALPQSIQGLLPIALNVGWRLFRDSDALFRRLDPALWESTRNNPVELLQRVGASRLAECARDPEFVAVLRRVEGRIAAELRGADSWFPTRWPEFEDTPIAYFCAEFGLHNSIPIYSGGLGILAGDHLKAASDLGIPLVAVGLLYSRGYFDQRIDRHGWQIDTDEPFDPATTPLQRMRTGEGSPVLAHVEARGREIGIGAWRLMVGRVPLFLLDTNLRENDVRDRELTSRLYGGGQDLRLLQEWILGVGGVRILRALGIAPRAWHANEGHASFMLVERLRELIGEGIPLEEAVPAIRSTSVFTTHTPVPAGHDLFEASRVDAVLDAPWRRMGLTPGQFHALGAHPVLNHGLFHMTVAGMRLSRHVNGVSRRHGRVTREIWKELWPGRAVDAIPVGEVTNGVHLRTWMAPPVRELLEAHLGPGWMREIDDPAVWDQVLTLDPARFWQIHGVLKSELLDFVREDARSRWRARDPDAAYLAGSGTLLAQAPLTIGFARRFATYKRGDLVFRDPERLRRILVDPHRPVQIVFAGKAHPADQGGKEILHRVHAFTRDPAFEGRIAFLEDYEMHMAHRLVEGVDLWLNLPRVPFEACGTSGMKAALNGVPQLATLDGWWEEGFTGDNGWALPRTGEGEDPDAADAEAVYSALEERIVPLFHDRDPGGLPRRWVEVMKRALWVAGARFSARRMLKEYAATFYVPALAGHRGGDDPPSG